MCKISLFQYPGVNLSWIHIQDTNKVSNLFSYVFLCSVFLNMSQVSVTTITITPPVTVVHPSASPIIRTVTVAVTSLGLPIVSTWCGSAATVDPAEHSEGFCWAHHYAAATATSVPDTFSDICQLYHGSSSGKFFIESRASHWFICYMLVSGMVCFSFPCCCNIHQSGLNPCSLYHHSPHSIPLVDICVSWLWSMAHARSALSGCSFHCFEWGNFMLLIQLSPAIQSIGGHTTLGAWQRFLIHLLSLHGGEGSSFPGCVLPDRIVNTKSVVGIKPGDSGGVIGYQVDEFTHTQVSWVLHSTITHLSWFHG